jgi:hypothetical protein
MMPAAGAESPAGNADTLAESTDRGEHRVLDARLSSPVA